ncbi:MAG: hypothetical protein AAGI38_06945 [Bacteroidota bacterium]
MRNLITPLLFLVHISFSFAQDSIPSRLAVGFMPQQLLNNAARPELFYHFQSGHRLLLAPVFYFGETNAYATTRSERFREMSQLNALDQVSGFGGEVQFQFHFGKTNVRQYVALGVGYHSIGLSFTDFDWVSTIRDDLPVLVYRLTPQQDLIRRVEILLLGGIHLIEGDYSRFDLFVGPVYKFTEIETTLEAPRDYENMWRDHGFGGLGIRGGFSFSFLII